jgi:hypothetical protein
MRADLEALRKVIRPTTEAEARASMDSYERVFGAELETAGFVYALEHDMREEYLECALRVAGTGPEAVGIGQHLASIGKNRQFEGTEPPKL